MKICVCDTDELISKELINNISDCFLSGETFSVKQYYSPEEMLFEDEKAVFDAYYINATREGLIAAEIIRSKITPAHDEMHVASAAPRMPISGKIYTPKIRQ